MFKQLTFSCKINKQETLDYSAITLISSFGSTGSYSEYGDLCERLDVDDVDQSEEERQSVLNSGHVGQKAALRKYLHHWEQKHNKKKEPVVKGLLEGKHFLSWNQEGVSRSVVQFCLIKDTNLLYLL